MRNNRNFIPRQIECNRLQAVHGVWARTVEPHLDVAIVCAAGLLAMMLGRIKKVKTPWGVAVFN